MPSKKKNWEAEWKQVAAESRKLAKRANQRMVRLERYSEREGYSNIKKYAYSRAKQYIENYTGKKGKPRKKKNVKLVSINDGTKELSGDELYKKNIQIQRQKIKAMQEFLASESSTMGESRSGPKTKGIKAIYDQRTNTINEKFLNQYGLEMTEKDLKRFFESKKQAKLESIVGSKDQFIVASVIKKYNIKGSREELEKFVSSHIDLNQYKELTPEDLKMGKRESRAKYLERLRKYLKYTDDDVLNSMVTNALQNGINIDNIFI